MTEFAIGDRVITLSVSNKKSHQIRNAGEIVSITAVVRCSACDRLFVNVDGRGINNGRSIVTCKCGWIIRTAVALSYADCFSLNRSVKM